MKITTPADPFTRCLAFVDEYMCAPDDADVEFRIGTDNNGKSAVCVTINGKHHGFLASEARKVADVMERALSAHPNESDSRGFPNAIMSLRHTADEADRANSTSNR